METREQSIQTIKRQVGWAYEQLNWPTIDQLSRMNEVRGQLLDALSGKVSQSYPQNKLHYGNLSPGCRACGDGTWTCLYVNGLCTADCFYCPQDRRMKTERQPATDDGVFRRPADFADFVLKVGIKGVGFSGGEPLLVYDKLLSFIKEIRQKVGEDVYLWTYTNGDLIDRNTLAGLKQAGLNEIRINIAARGYDLRPVEMAVKFIDTVSVEIPAIPEDLAGVKAVMRAMQHLGVAYLNLHQLLTTEHNYKALAQRNYTSLHHAGIPVFESEITALQLLQYGVETGLSLPVNYCSQSYKERIHSRSRRWRAACFVRKNFEDITASGYIRNLSIESSADKLEQLAGVLKETGCPDTRWSLNRDLSCITIYPSLLPYIDHAKCRFVVRYFKPYFRGSSRNSLCDGADHEMVKASYYNTNTLNNANSAGSVQLLELNHDVTFFAIKEPAIEYQGLSPVMIKTFYKLFIEGEPLKETLRWFSQNYVIKTKDDIKSMAREREILRDMAPWEQLATDFPEIY